MCRLMAGWLEKNSHASSHERSRISATFLPRNVMSSVSRLYRAPLHTSHGTYTSGRKCISILIVPSPAHASERPPFTLKLKRPRRSPRTRDSCVCAISLRTWSNTPVYVAALDLGVRPIGDWSTLTTLSSNSIPVIDLCRPGGCLDL